MTANTIIKPKRHARRLTNPKLQRLLEALTVRVGGSRCWKSTRDLVQETGIMAINSAVSELRAHGLKIECQRVEEPEGRRFYYRLM